MHQLDQRALGIVILVLLGLLVIVKRLATGSVLESLARDNLWVWLTNGFNLFFLLVVIPATSVLLIAGRLETWDPTHLAIQPPRLVAGLESAGLALTLTGFFLMGWALLSLQNYYQLGGSAPRADDELVSAGPYRLLRHPMYTAVLSISVGLALLVQSLALFAVFCTYFALLCFLIPIEEQRLKQVYHDRYRVYQDKVKKLIPYLY